MKKVIMSYEKSGAGIEVIEYIEPNYKFFSVVKFNEQKKLKSLECASLNKATEIFSNWINELEETNQ